MNWFEKIESLLKNNLSEDAYAYWVQLNESLVPVWERPSSSTGKYHRRKDGSGVPSIAEHTYEMLHACEKVVRLFPYKSKSIKCDQIFLAVALHDAMKYGEDGSREHTTSTHDKLMADYLVVRDLMSKMIRYHQGQWSTDAKADEQIGEKFDWMNHDPEVLFIHVLDMLSTADCLKV